MTETDTLDGFFLALRESPGDAVTLHALADWYEEQGRPSVAACVRWCLRRGRRPFQYRRGTEGLIDSPSFADGWFWWAVGDGPHGNDWGHPPTCRLPGVAWRLLDKRHSPTALVVKHYPTLRAAYEAFFEVWTRFAPSEREGW